jgi:curli production assembly/transport component CsgG
MGIGGNTEYRLDNVTVDLRTVSVRNGRVFSTVSASKSIYSVLLQSGVFKIFGSNNLLEAEAGFTRNEPTQLAVRQAVEKAVYAMVVEGSLTGLWQFADATAGRRLASEYMAERNGDVVMARRQVTNGIPEIPPPAGPAAPALLKEERELLGQQPAQPPAGDGEFRSGFGPSGPLPSGAARNQLQLQRSAPQ